MTAANKQRVQLQAIIPDSLQGTRLDQALSQLFEQYSRARLSQWIKQGQARIDGEMRRPKDKVQGGEQVHIDAELVHQGPAQAEAIALDIVYEDDSLLVLNKPAGLVVHPAAGNPAGTLQNALLHHDPDLAVLPRAGIVHRLDKLTSGLMVVARSLEAHHSLVAQLQARDVSRQYLALVQGRVTAGGCVDAPIGRHARERKRMAVSEAGKPARSHYRVEQRFAHYTLLRVSLETGRTHQIRVHMAHIHHPLVGDPVYAGRPRLPKGASEALIDGLRSFRRQALHAEQLALTHPHSGEMMQWNAVLPADFADLLALLQSEDAL